MTNAYQLNDIRFFYGKTLALSLPKLVVQASKVTALIGANGCGKSTLLNLLAFLVPKQQGTIQLFSESLNKKNQNSLIKRIAFVPQKPYLLRGTVSDNLRLALKFHHVDKPPASLIQAVLKDFNIVHLSQQPAKTLSGGELQKVALARAIITNPDVLLMDEPFSYLDQASAQLLEQFILQYVKNTGKTLVFSTHNRLQGCAIADNVISLVNGKSVETPLINLFQGSISEGFFNTGKINIMLANNTQDYLHISIAPDEIVLSRHALVSSMRNQFEGKVMAIADENGKVRVAVLAGELFQVIITKQALKALNISLGDMLWVAFKSNAIVAF